VFTEAIMIVVIANHAAAAGALAVLALHQTLADSWLRLDKPTEKPVAHRPGSALGSWCASSDRGVGATPKSSCGSTAMC
jgi:hypothetical protein